MTSAYWWRGSAAHQRKNFGDLLTPLLLQRFAGITPTWAKPEDAHLLVVGSILESVEKFPWYGTVFGSGKLYERTKVTETACILGLRGHLSAKGVKGTYVIGDPGLLADELVRTTKEHNLGLLPHWSDKTLATRPEFLKYDPLIIQPENDDPLEVLRQIGSCRKIVTSSLHGVILSDAFGIPRRIEYSPTLDREGGVYKFKDYLSSIGMVLELGLTQAAPRNRVEDRQHELFDGFETLGSMVHDDLKDI